jgi:hypothetical protein
LEAVTGFHVFMKVSSFIGDACEHVARSSSQGPADAGAAAKAKMAATAAAITENFIIIGTPCLTESPYSVRQA